MGKSCFSDKSHFKVHGRKSQYVRRSVGEPLNTFYILQAPKHSQKKMFWGCFTLNDTGRLCTSEGMMKSTKYQEILEKDLVSTMQKSFSDGNGIFQQDKAPCHTSKNANIFLKIEINFARLAWQLPIPKPHRKLVGYRKKVSLNM